MKMRIKTAIICLLLSEDEVREIIEENFPEEYRVFVEEEDGEDIAGFLDGPDMPCGLDITVMSADVLENAVFCAAGGRAPEDVSDRDTLYYIEAGRQLGTWDQATHGVYGSVTDVAEEMRRHVLGYMPFEPDSEDGMAHIGVLSGEIWLTGSFCGGIRL